MPKRRDTRTVVIGGGTGTFTVLSALKKHVSDITAIINMVDDGGSTGVLRDELGVLPPGDVRQSLVALSPESHLMRDLLNYRFEEGSLEGHPFGNLFLSALEKTTGSFEAAVKAAGQILAIEGTVIPVTTVDTRLCLKRVDGTVLKSQRVVGESFFTVGERPEVYLEPRAPINPDAAAAIAEADLIVFGPGNFYSSLVPNLLIEGMGQALRGAAGTRVFVCNLVNKPGQTEGFKVHDFVERLEEYGGGELFDYVVYDNERPSEELLERYRQVGEEWVEADENALKNARYTAVGESLLSRAPAGKVPPQPEDTAVYRSLIRHDSEKLAHLLLQIVRLANLADD